MDIVSLIPLLQMLLSLVFSFPKMCGILIFFAQGILCRPPAFVIQVSVFSSISLPFNLP